MKQNDIYVTPSQAAKILNVSLATLKKFIYQGKIKTLKTPGGHHRILRTDLFKVTSFEKSPQFPPISSDKVVSKTIEEFLDLLGLRQHYLKDHSFAVAELSLKLASAFKLSPSQFYRLYIAALLHDIGLICINKEIINKSSPLSENEYKEIKTHPLHGEELVTSVEQLKEISTIIRQHHERYDGKGYPDGLNGEQICIEAKIINLAEAFACMTADDSYKKTLSEKEALQEIEKNKGIQFDTGIADVFLKLFKERQA